MRLTPGDLVCLARARSPAPPGTAEHLLALVDFVREHVLHEELPPPTTDPVEVLRVGSGWCDHRVGVFVWLLWEGWRLHAEPVQLRCAKGKGHVIAAVHLPDDVPSTSGWACVDVDHRHVYRAPDGRLAHPLDLRAWPDWVAAERASCSDSETTAPDWMFFGPTPRSLNFQIGDRCNARCVMCWQSLRRDDTDRDTWWKEMRPEVVEELVARYARDLESVEFVSFGEPMINPGFDRMVTAVWEASQRRPEPILVNVITNGSLLHRHMRLVELPGYLTFSIDAADPALYERIRIGLQWDEVYRNLETAARSPTRHAGRKIGVNFTIFEDNADQVLPMAALCARLDLSYLSVLYGDLLDATAARGRQITQDDPRLLQGLDDARRLYPNLTIQDFATGRTLAPVAAAPVLPGRGFCPLPWRQLDVGPDGQAHPCCRSHGTPLGDSAGDAWTGSALTRLREQILSDDVDPVEFGECARCPNLEAGVRGAARPGHLPVVP